VAALLDERDRVAGRRVGIVLTGGNIDSSTFAAILEGTTPTIDSTET
jgi:threonine dehydratase